MDELIDEDYKPFNVFILFSYVFIVSSALPALDSNSLHRRNSLEMTEHKCAEWNSEE